MGISLPKGIEGLVMSSSYSCNAAIDRFIIPYVAIDQFIITYFEEKVSGKRVV